MRAAGHFLIAPSGTTIVNLSLFTNSAYGSPFGASGFAGVGVAGTAAEGWATGEVVVTFGMPNRTNITAPTMMRAAIKIGIIGFDRIGFPPLFLSVTEPLTTEGARRAT